MDQEYLHVSLLSFKVTNNGTSVDKRKACLGGSDLPFVLLSHFLFQRAAWREIQPTDLSKDYFKFLSKHHVQFSLKCSFREKSRWYHFKEWDQFLLFHIQVGADSRLLATTGHLYSATWILKIVDHYRFNLLNPATLMHQSLQTHPAQLNIVPEIPNMSGWILEKVCWIECQILSGNII